MGAGHSFPAGVEGYHGRKMFQAWTRVLELLETGEMSLKA